MIAANRLNRQEPWWARERIWGQVGTVVIHVLVVYGLTLPKPLLLEKEEVPMELVFRIPLTLATAKSLPIAPSRRKEAAPSLASGGNTSNAANTDAHARSIQDIQIPAITQQAVPTPTQVTQGDDTWDRPKHADGLTFRRDPLSSGPNPLTSIRPERFRMRKQLTPHDIVREVSKIFFWPPGYTDDPCGEIRRSVERLSGFTDDTSRWQLIEAVKAESRYCQSKKAPALPKAPLLHDTLLHDLN